MIPLGPKSIIVIIPTLVTANTSNRLLLMVTSSHMYSPQVKTNREVCSVSCNNEVRNSVCYCRAVSTTTIH